MLLDYAVILRSSICQISQERYTVLLECSPYIGPADMLIFPQPEENRLSDENIVKILREADQTRVADAARKHSLNEQSIYRWCRLYDGMQVNDGKEFKRLKDEYTRLKKLLSERDLELDVIK